ncbi:hypothetical protein [Salipiger bermudensis]|uniref:Uncharacterized protein n=1 Tax=Salipiger bermudensis (strain DSM 26914 / JCM 13377 / KCTC 12554 / HTCC2601) TaxID=314265 RepID=Q0FLK6_SALBH|nr:hypothetical protein [Salipiger bermudensis]EAU45092.1 hypothetical protein R2601_22936 [Salipiger bermudensis HTCC2601]
MPKFSDDPTVERIACQIDLLCRTVSVVSGAVFVVSLVVKVLL